VLTAQTRARGSHMRFTRAGNPSAKRHGLIERLWFLWCSERAITLP